MTTKHTPGPWHVGSAFGEQFGGLVIDGYPILGGGRAIARVWVGTSKRIINDETGTHNARLIAAAPELLEACNNALSMIQDIRAGYQDRDLHMMPGDLLLELEALVKRCGVVRT